MLPPMHLTLDNPSESRSLPPSPLVPPVYAGRVAAGATTTRSTPHVYDLTKGDLGVELPWVVELRQGMHALLSGQQGLSADIQRLSSTLTVHEARIQRLTEAHQDNARLHENTQRRLKTLETEVEELKRASRSPTPARGPGSNAAPARLDLGVLLP